jgi:hypothetical protein
MKATISHPTRAFFVLILAATVSNGEERDWRKFINRAGWSIKFPPIWRVESCRACDDPTEPNAPLFLSDPSGDQTILIERLADKPSGKSVDVWLHEVAKDTVLAPIHNEQQIPLSGSKALKVANEGSENIYVVRGSLTIALRYKHPIRAVTRVVSTFRFEHPK